MRHGGFSLVEISVVLVVVATMLAGVLPAITEGTKVRDIDTTADRMRAIEQSAQAHFATEGELPCPADITLGINSANFGVEGAGADCQTGSPQANWTNGGNIVGGGVPTKTLGLPDEYAFDGWGRRIYYHVDTRATDSATFDSAGGITVKDSASGNRTTTAVYALVSAGRNGHGSYTRAGSRITTYGTPGNRELENCGVSTAALCNKAYDATLMQALEQTDTVSNTIFDDIVAYKLRGHLLTGGGDTLWTANGNDIVNTNSGNVGIGTTTPDAELDVESFDTDGAAVRITSLDTGGLTYTLRSNGSNGIPSPAGSFSIAELSSGTARLTIAPSGNVGIGTPSPDGNSKLQVAGDVVSTLGAYGQFRAVQGNYGTIIRNDGSETYLLVTPSGSPYGAWNGLRPFTMNNATGNLALGNGAMYVFHGGNVGIGTGAPDPSRLVVAANTTAGYAVHGWNGSGHGVIGQTAAGGSTYYGVTGSSGSYWTGIARADGYGLVSNGHLYAGTANVYAGAFYYTSDERLKRNIRPIEGLDLVTRLTGVRFHWKKDGRPSIGLVAQAVEKVLPELVTEDMDGNKRVDYGLLVAPLIEAVKELKTLLDTMADTIAGLMKADQRHDVELEALKDRVDALEHELKQCGGAR